MLFGSIFDSFVSQRKSVTSVRHLFICLHSHRFSC